MADRSVTNDARRASLEYADRAFEHIEACRRKLKRGSEKESVLDALEGVDAALRRIVQVLTDEGLALYRAAGASESREKRDFIRPLAASDALLDSLVKVGTRWRSLRQLTAPDCRIVASQCRSTERAWRHAAHAFDVLRRTLLLYDEAVTVGEVMSEEKLREILGASTKPLLKRGAGRL